MSTKTVLVTGGAGFIGANVVRQLAEQGRQVRVFDNFYRSDADTVAELKSLPNVEIFEGDVRYRSSVERAMTDIDEVVHLAAICLNKSISDPEESLEVNLVGSQHVFESAARHGISRLMFASSASVYGDPEVLPMVESTTLFPITPYCISKLACEQLLRFTAKRSEMEWLAFRFFNVYGPRQPTDAYYTSVVLTFLRRIAAGEAPVIDGTGEQSMDFIHVDDVARAVTTGLLSTASGSVLNVGSGTQTTIAELAGMLARISETDVVPQFRPRDVLVSRRQADVTAIASLLGWAPRVDLEDGLREVVAELRSSGELPALAGS